MYFAGPICEGWGCTPLLIVVLITFLAPLVIGVCVVWFLTGIALKRLNKHKARFVTKKSALFFRIGLTTLVGLIVLSLYLLPNMELYKNFEKNRGISKIGNGLLYQPKGLTPKNVNIYLYGQGGFFSKPSYQSKSTFVTESTKVVIQEDKSGKTGYIPHEKSDLTCNVYQNSNYCYLDAPGYRKVEDLGQFYLTYRSVELQVDFDNTADPISELHKLLDAGLEQKPIKDLQNVTYTTNVLEL